MVYAVKISSWRSFYNKAFIQFLLKILVIIIGFNTCMFKSGCQYIFLKITSTDTLYQMYQRPILVRLDQGLLQWSLTRCTRYMKEPLQDENKRMNEKKEADSCRQRGTIKHSYICPFSVVVGSLESKRQFWQPATASVAVTH